jgi:hypothetical protein
MDDGHPRSTDHHSPVTNAMTDDFATDSLTPEPTTPTAAARPEVVTQHYIDPDTGARRETKVRILTRGRRKPAAK